MRYWELFLSSSRAVQIVSLLSCRFSNFMMSGEKTHPTATSQRHMQRKKKNPRNEKASECCCLVNRADKMKWPHIFCDKTPKKVERRLWWRWQILWKWNLLEDLHWTVILNHWPCVWILVYSVNKKGVVNRVRLAQKAAASEYNILNQGTRYWAIQEFRQGFSTAFFSTHFWLCVFEPLGNEELY